MATLLSGNLTDELTGQRAVAGGIFTPSWVLRNARGFARSSDLTGSSQLPGAVVWLLSLPTREGQDQRGCVRAMLWFLNGAKEEDMRQNEGFHDTALLSRSEERSQSPDNLWVSQEDRNSDKSQPLQFVMLFVTIRRRAYGKMLLWKAKTSPYHGTSLRLRA